MSSEQLRALEERFHFDFYVYDEPLAPVFAHATLSKKSLPLSHPTANSATDCVTSRPTGGAGDRSSGFAMALLHFV
jgi:hypothetical protein